MKRIIVLIVLVITMVNICMAQGSETIDQKKIGYYHALDLGAGIRGEYQNTIPWSVSIRETHGIQFNPHFVLGINIEFQYISSCFSDGGGSDVFLFSGGLDFRYFILKKYKWTPFLWLSWNAGMKLTAAQDLRPTYNYRVAIDGFFDLPTLFLGCNYKYRGEKSIYFALGYDFAAGASIRVGTRF